MKTTLKVTELTHEDLVNFLSTATYDSYWVGVRTNPMLGAVIPTNMDAIKAEFEKTNGEYCREDKWADILLNGGKIVCVDFEDLDENGEEGKCYPISLEDVYKGMNKAYKECPKNLINIINEDEDFNDADNVLQCILFGEVVYC